MIKVEHDSMRLPAAAAVLVTDAHLANRYLDRFLPNKVERGLRIRRTPDKKKSLMYFSARNYEHIRCAITALRYAGFVKKVFPGKRVEL